MDSTTMQRQIHEINSMQLICSLHRNDINDGWACLRCRGHTKSHLNTRTGGTAAVTTVGHATLHHRSHGNSTGLGRASLLTDHNGCEVQRSKRDNNSPVELYKETVLVRPFSKIITNNLQHQQLQSLPSSFFTLALPSQFSTSKNAVLHRLRYPCRRRRRLCRSRRHAFRRQLHLL